MKTIIYKVKHEIFLFLKIDKKGFLKVRAAISIGMLLINATLHTSIPDWHWRFFVKVTESISSPRPPTPAKGEGL